MARGLGGAACSCLGGPAVLLGLCSSEHGRSRVREPWLHLEELSAESMRTSGSSALILKGSQRGFSVMSGGDYVVIRACEEKRLGSTISACRMRNTKIAPQGMLHAKSYIA